MFSAAVNNLQNQAKVISGLQIRKSDYLSRLNENQRYKDLF